MAFCRVGSSWQRPFGHPHLKLGSSWFKLALPFGHPHSTFEFETWLELGVPVSQGFFMPFVPGFRLFATRCSVSLNSTTSTRCDHPVMEGEGWVERKCLKPGTKGVKKPWPIGTRAKAVPFPSTVIYPLAPVSPAAHDPSLDLQGCD